MELSWNWETLNLIIGIIGAAATLGTVLVASKKRLKRLRVWINREREIRKHIVKLDGLEHTLSFTNISKPLEHKVPPLDVGEIWGATQSGRTPFFVSAPFTDLALATREAQRARKRLLLFVYDATHSRQSDIRQQLGAALDYFPIKRIVDENFVVCLAPIQAPGIGDLVPEGSWLEKPLMYAFDLNGSLQWRRDVYANPGVMKGYLEAIQSGENFIDKPDGA